MYSTITALCVVLREACVFKRYAPVCVLRICIWPPKRDDSSRVLIGAGGIERSDWPEHV